MLRRLVPVLSAVVAILAGGPVATAFAVTPSVAVGSSAVLNVLQGTTAPVGNVTLTESAPGQLAVNDVITIRLKDSASASTLHLTTTPVVSGTNGLAATLAVASSSGTLQDEVVLTVTQNSASSAFPGVLTVAQLNPAIDAGAATGSASAYATDTGAVVSTTPAAVASVLTAATQKATFTPVTQPTLTSTGSNQVAGNISLSEPVKDFFKSGDVITFRVRDADGSADTVGLTTTPFASGGAMSVSVHGLNGPTVQPNETGFTVSVDTQDPSNGSTSTLTVSNIVLNTAQAPSGPITLTASIAGGSVGTEYIVPGRVTVATVGGATSTSSAGDAVLTVPGTQEAAGNVTITAQAGALRTGDTFSVAIQEAGVTFTAANPPVTSLTAGNLSLSSAAATLDAGDVTATWTVQNPNTVPSTIVIGPIYYDVSAGAVAGDKVSLKLSGGGSFTSQTVTDATLVSSPSGQSMPLAAPPASATSPVPGANVQYVEPAAGSLTANNSALVLLSPYASQISAYRTTFAAPPSASATNGLTLGAPIVNTQTISVTLAPNVIVSAPPQTAAIFPVTAASSGSPSTVTFSGLSYALGNFVPPGVLLGTATADVGTGVITAASTAVNGTVSDTSNQFADAIDANGLGSASAGDTTPPETFLDGGPANGITVFNTTSVTFSFHSSEDPYATFMCTLISHTTSGDSSTIIENHCGQQSNVGGAYEYTKTYPSLADGSYQFYVQATDANNNTDPTPAGASFNIGFDNTAPTATITNPKTLTAPVVVTFDEPVKNVSPSTFTLTPAPAAGTPITCLNGTAATDCAAGPVTKASLTASGGFVPGQTYHVTLNPVGVIPAITDIAGNALATTTSTFRASTNEQETSSAAVYSWKKISMSSASGGSYAEDHAAGASASYRFTGTSVTWYTVTGKNMGKATVYVDGAKKLSINNYATSTHYGVARTVGSLSNATHTVKVVVAGVKGASAATDDQVAVDRFVAGATTAQDNAPAVVYTWRSVAATGASGGHYAIDDLAGSTVSFTFVSGSLTWYTVTSPAMGKATVYVDGVKKGTFDNFSSSTKYGVKRTFGSLGAGTHILRIVVLGTHRSGATGSNIAVDRWTMA